MRIEGDWRKEGENDSSPSPAYDLLTPVNGFYWLKGLLQQNTDT